MALFSFSPNSEDTYCAVSADNRLSVWSNQTQQQFVDKDHLLSKCTSIAWQNVGTQKKSSNMGLIALGMENGSVSVWDLSRGLVSQKLGKDSNLASVTDVAFSIDGKSVFSSSSDKYIIEWDIESGSIKNKFKGDKSGTSKLCVSTANKCIAAASLSIRLLDMETGKCKQKLNGSHSSKVTMMNFSANGEYLVSASSNVRVINLFSVEKEELIRSYSLLHNPVQILVGQFNQFTSIVSSSENGAVELFRFDKKDESKDNADKETLELGESVLGVKFLESSPHTHLLISSGTPTLPKVTEEQYANEEGKLGASSSEITDEGMSGSTSMVVVGGDHHMLGPSDKGNSRLGTEVDFTLPVTKRIKASNDPNNDMSIAERLEAMASTLAKTSSENKSYALKQTPKGESLVSVLEQALQSRDDNLLEECLVVTDLQVVEATVNRMSPTHVLPFLMVLSEKVERSPTRGLSLCAWMRCVLTKHSSYLMSVPNLHLKLASLYQILDDRASVFPKLLNLNGRLELALSQISPSEKEVSDEEFAHTYYDEAIEEALAENEEEEEEDDEEEEEEE